MRRALIVMSVVCAVACGHKRDNHPPDAGGLPRPPPPATGSVAGSGSAAAPAAAAGSGSAAAPAAGSGSAAAPAVVPTAPDAPAGNPPPDGKYEHVMVEGVTVPMIEVMKGGTIVLVDTDGKKPRTWEEQYKKKTAKLPGQFDLHKTDANKNGKFDDDPVDREGLWLIDAKGNITKH
ncbi:MAG TPA: hypothetical protein VH165_09615 [Kofleriaceae bacterium]|nr:hypothetical protein [Kofleriaceae bacterium]